ncbi:hypothetical protein [Microseira wollei]|uniref:Uncharacterized protein n=1 Tax=Microseira wollei NIES-4236 TaxID=2530354 RepID=A0AAV3WHZ9_9CYAN|nr:hypothetical protein [Microseira wollei]GET38874.1 hypothetical protein MiSe_36330 [Microseira wollei NIES-4236]
MRFILNLVPELPSVFLARIKGKICCYKIHIIFLPINFNLEYTNQAVNINFRKPKAGMIELAYNEIASMKTNPILLSQSQNWMVGDRPEDQRAESAGINFCPADVWRQHFLKGTQEFNVTPAQLEFLTGVKL